MRSLSQVCRFAAHPLRVPEVVTGGGIQLMSRLLLYTVCNIGLLLTLYVQTPSPAVAADAGEGDKKAVLVVNSYHPGYVWSDDVVRGVQSVFDKDDSVELFLEYLDTKRHLDEAYLRQVEQLLRHKYQATEIDAIITSDDNALDLVLRMRESFLSNVPLIFCGIDHVEPERIAGHAPIYGIEESDGTRATVDLILSIHPGTRSIVFVADRTPTGELMSRAVRAAEPSYRGSVAFDFLTDLTVTDLQAALKRAPQDAVILYLSFIRDSSGKVLSIGESMRLVSDAANVPVYCTWGFRPGTGVVGGSVRDGFTQGRMSAEITTRLLQSQDASGIAPVQEAPLIDTFDFQAMARFGIGVEDLPAGSVVHNKPLSVYEAYRWIILATLGFVACQTFLVGFLLQSRMRRKRAETTVHSREATLRTLLNAPLDSIVLCDNEGILLSINEMGARRLGASPEELTGRYVYDLLPPDVARSRKAHIDKVLETGQATHFEDSRAGMHISNSVYPIAEAAGGKAVGFAIYASDITERRQAEEQLRRSEERFRSLIEQSPASIQIHGPEGQLIVSNAAYAALYGLSEKQLAELYGAYNVREDAQAEGLGLLPYIEKVYAGEAVVFPSYAYSAPDTLKALGFRDSASRNCWIETRGFPLKDESGDVTSVVFISEDITERKQAEAALRESEAAHKALYENAIVALFRVATMDDGRILAANEAAARLFGYATQEAFIREFRSPNHYVNPEDREPVLRQLRETGRIDWIEIHSRKADGSAFWSQASFTLMEEEGYVECVAIDVTERKRTEKELIHLERLRAVGELSAGVSHNLNNILTNVLGPAQLLKRKTDDPELLLEVDSIVTSAIRARDLVHDLHRSVRTPEEKSLYPVAVDQILTQTVETSRPRWRDEPEAQGISIEMVTQWGGVPPIQGTEAGLHDIFTNFIFNAVDAMPEGGMITIGTQHIEDQVEISFSDTGTGMNEETKRRIFEPFFTTKMDLGTGLGLSTVHSTVTRWGGTIEVDSTPREGTTFTLCFPVSAGKVIREEGRTAVESTRSGMVLVVDDDEAICRLLSRLLSEHHEVEITTDGLQALERFAPGKYDVVILDLGMPRISGDQMLEQMIEIDPHVATVLSTGWGLSDTDARVSSFDFRIVKPFDDLDEVEGVVTRAIELHDQRIREDMD
jgi:two-component system, cell cycle sensor histidine kinase and response regulator CckA